MNSGHTSSVNSVSQRHKVSYKKPTSIVVVISLGNDDLTVSAGVNVIPNAGIAVGPATALEDFGGITAKLNSNSWLEM